MTSITPSISSLDAVPPVRAPANPGPILHVGGTHTLAVIARELLLELREQGWNIHVACAEEDWGRRLREDGFPMHVIRLPHRPSLGQAVTGTRDLARLLRGGSFRLVHTHNAHNGVIGRSLARLFGLPSVHTWRYSPLDAVSARPAKLGLGLAEALASRAGQAVLFQNEEDMRFAIESHLVPARRAVLVGNGIRLGGWTEGGLEAGVSPRAELGIEPGAELVGCVARLVERKGQPYLLEAVARLVSTRSRLRLLLIGDGPKEDELRGQTERLGISDRVVFAGHRDDVPRLLRASDLMCLPSRREGVPRAVMEAMASGVPVVATDVVGTREVVEHEVTGLLVPYAEPDPLAAAIERVLDDRELRARLTARARATVERDWRAESVAARVSGEYRRLVAPRR